MYLYGCVSLLTPECAVCVCVCVCVCVISNQSTSKKPHYKSDLFKVLLVLRYEGSTCVDP